MRFLRRLIVLIIEKLTGSKMLSEWFGNGAKSVSPREASRRAAICVNCPLNGDESLAKEMAAVTFKKWVDLKNRMALHTTCDKSLHFCKACGCFLPTKVWTPYEYLKQYQTDDVADKIRAIQPRCWQL